MTLSKHTQGSKRHTAATEKPDYSDSPLKPVEKAEGPNEHPKAIPTAGGVMLGAQAMEKRASVAAERRASQAVQQPGEVSTDGQEDMNATTAAISAKPAAAATGAPHEGTSAGTAASQSDAADVRKSLESGGSGRRGSGTIGKLKEKLHLGGKH